MSDSGRLHRHRRYPIPGSYYRCDNNADVIIVGTFRPERIVAIADRFGVGEYLEAIKELTQADRET